MDINFACPNCNVLLTADDSMVGDEIQCPQCSLTFNVPEGTPAPPPAPAVDPTEEILAATSTPELKPRQRINLTLPSSAPGTSALIEKANKPLEVSAKQGILFVVRTIRRSECIVNGKDRFDDMVAEVLSGVGEEHLHSITPISYSYLDKASQHPLADYGVMIIYKKQ
ncbi:MAG: hypothetical protein ACO1QS_10485 [Verrucomicrobiota bacterium]